MSIEKRQTTPDSITWQEILWSGLIFALLALIPASVFWWGLPCSDDTLTHFYRVVQFDLNIQDGAPFLQWGPDFLRGYGYNILAFYAPLTYWLVELIHLLGANIAVAMQILSVLVLWWAGWGTYLFARHFIAPLGAFIAGIAYLFAPYILYDAIQRGSLPETLALSLVPWALATSLRALDNPRPRAIVLAALALAGVILSHNVVSIFAVGMIVLFSLVTLSRPVGNIWAGLWQQLRPLCLILGFALGITLFFWLPSLVELQYTQSTQADQPQRQWPNYSEEILAPQFLFALPSDPADANLINPPLVKALSRVQAVLALIGVITLIWYPRSHQKRRLLVMVLVTGASIFFAIQPSLWWWEHVRLLNFIHLPVRFLGPASLGIALFTGVAIDQFIRWFSGAWSQRILVVIAALAAAISGWFWLYPRYCPVPTETTRLVLAQSTTWQRWYAEAQAETLPRWVKDMPPQDSLLPQYEVGEPVNRLVLPDTGTQLDWQTGAGWDSYTLDLAEPETLLYQTIYFPGWRAKVDGQAVSIVPTEAVGLMSVDVPAGQHTFEIAFGSTPIRAASFIVSLIVLVVMLWWWWRADAGNNGRYPAQTAPPFKQALPLLIFTTILLLVAKYALVDRISTPIRADRFQNGQIVGISTPANINFSDEMAHLGFTGPPEVNAAEAFIITQYWTPLRDIGVPYGLGLQIVDDNGARWNTPVDRPYDFTYFPGPEKWQAGEYARDAYALNLQTGTPPGIYWLEASVFRRDTDLSLMPTGAEPGSSPAQARLGALQVLPGTWTVNADTAQVDVFQPTPVISMPPLTLLGWTIPDVVWRPGELAMVDLLWQGDSPILDERVVVDLLLMDEDGETMAKTAVIVGAPGAENVVRDKVQWRLPPGLETGLHTVMLSSGDQTIELGQWQIDAPSRTFERPKVDITSDFRMGFAELIGYSLSETAVMPGSTVELELVWQAAAETPTSYRVFVHLLDENGNLAAQSDAIPDNWTRPTTGWVPGEFIRDQHQLTLPVEVAPGEYNLVVGFYDPATGVRLGAAEIGVLTVSDG